MSSRSGQHCHTRNKGQWYERGEGARRLAHDKSLVAISYPSLHYQRAANEYLELVGELGIEIGTGTVTNVPVRIVFPPEYPFAEPYAYDVSNRFAHTLDRHFYEDEHCCLWLPAESRWRANDINALDSFLIELGTYFHRQLIYEVLGRWPGPARSHGLKGHLEFLCELLDCDLNIVLAFTPILADVSSITAQDPCPCGSSTKYGECHERKIAELVRRVDRKDLIAIFLPIVGLMLAQQYPVFARLLRRGSTNNVVAAYNHTTLSMSQSDSLPVETPFWRLEAVR